MGKTSSLVNYLFEGKHHQLSTELGRWVEDSPRFRDFVEVYRDKIRKKIRVVREPQSLLDLSGELEIAYQLLGDQRLDLEYEPYASQAGRGADFCVTYRANLRFNIEVARLHAEDSELTGPRRNEERVLRIVLGKLGQMQTRMPNILLIHLSKQVSESIDLGKLMQELKTMAETKVSGFYERAGYANPTKFFKDFLRLTGVLFWVPDGQIWNNKQANVKLDEKIFRLIRSKAVHPLSST